MKYLLLLAPLAFAASALAQPGGEVASPDLLRNDTKYTTEVVTHFTTFCPSATVITMGGQTRTVTEATTLTILDCSCTVTKPVTSTTTYTTTPTTTPTTSPCLPTTTGSETTIYYTTCTDAPLSPSPSSHTGTDTPLSPSSSPSPSSPTCPPSTPTTPAPPTSSDPLPTSTSKCKTETTHQGGVTSAPTDPTATGSGSPTATTTFSQVITGAANGFGGKGKGIEGGVVGVVVAVLALVV